MVVKVLGNDDVRPGHGHRGIGAGAQAQLDVRTSRQPRDARINADDMRPTLHEVDDRVPEHAGVIALEGSFAPHNNHLRSDVLRIVVSAFEAGSKVHFRIERANGHRGRHHSGLIAGETGETTSKVRRFENAQDVILLKHAVATRSHEHGKCFPAVLCSKLAPLRDDKVNGFVPADALPCVLAAIFASTLHGINHAARVVDVVLESNASRTETAVRDRVVLVTFHVV